MKKNRYLVLLALLGSVVLSGVVTAEEMKPFPDLDRDGDGYITTEEFGIEVKEDVFDAADHDKDGMLNEPEYNAMIHSGDSLEAAAEASVEASQNDME